MANETGASLEALAEQDVVSRPLALLQAASLELAFSPQWSVEVTRLSTNPPQDDIPYLHQTRLEFEHQALDQLHASLVGVLETTGVVSDRSRLLGLQSLEPDRLARAAIEWDAETLSALADEVGIDAPIVITLGHCLALPVALKAGEQAGDQESSEWNARYCPTCGNWPLLAEQRGLDRQLWLRCGRCSAAWRGRHQFCVYCGNSDHRHLGYLAPEDQRESRRANTCQECRGYLKVFASVAPFGHETLLRQDLESLELDVAAIEADFNRPERPGFAISVELVPKRANIRKWMPWA